MLKELNISHIILIERAEIHFDSGFTVLSGETGAGKSAIMEALKLVLGGRTDAGLIRHGAEKGSISAVFDLENLPKAKNYLIEKGIDSDDPNLLIVKREISLSGKTRAAINHQPVQLGILRELGELLLELVGQHANHKLFHLDQHRNTIDLYGSHCLEEYASAWKGLQKILEELQSLKKAIPSALREIETCQKEIKEIEEAKLKEGEEEELFDTYSLLASATDRVNATQELVQTFETIFSLLAKSKGSYNSLKAADSKFGEEIALHPQIMVETEELLLTLRKYESRLDADPVKLDGLYKRLSFIEKFKRKYGNSLNEIAAYHSAQKQRLEVLINLESELEEKTAAYDEKLLQVSALAAKLSAEREKTAKKFSKKMTTALDSLNMKSAHFQIEFTPVSLNITGKDKVEFFLHTNVGEKLIALKDSASGGELARVLLALHLLLAGKEKIGTLIFDEIDANIGGTTAAMMGDHLKILGQSMQIISITHFPQVAKCATHHLQIAKSTKNGRTLSQVAYLEHQSREAELARMAGTTLVYN